MLHQFLCRYPYQCISIYIYLYAANKQDVCLLDCAELRTIDSLKCLTTYWLLSELAGHWHVETQTVLPKKAATICMYLKKVPLQLQVYLNVWIAVQAVHDQMMHVVSCLHAALSVTPSETS